MKSISKQTQSTKTVQTIKEHHGSTLDNLMEGCQIIGKDWRFLYVNDTAAKQGRRSKEELFGRTMMECFPGIETTEMFTTLRRCMEERTFHSMENEFTFPDGTKGCFELCIEPVPEGLFILSIDITHQKEAERAQAELLDRFNKIAAHVPGFIYQYRLRPDGSSHFPYASEGARTIYGLSPEEVKEDASAVFKVLHPDDFERVSKSISESAQRLALWHDEYRVTLPSGKTIWVEGRATPQKMEDGSILWHGYIADITERKKVEQQVLRTERMESVGNLAGGIVHDMNNILSPIVLVLGILRKKLSDSRDQQMMNLLETNAKRAVDLMKQILTFARGSEVERSSLQLSHLIDEIMKFIKATFPANISCEANIPKNLWTILGDSTQIHQVLLNLSVNAGDAMPQGGTLTFEAENISLDEQYSRMFPEAKPGPYIRLKVRDTGMGMTSEIKSKIFDPFFTTKEIGKGTGLGLSTLFSIVKGHNGFIDVYSEVGKGTEFRLYLPASELAETKEAQIKSLGGPHGNGELILVVDDEAAIREISTISLEAVGYEVLRASDGAQALSLYAQRQNDITLVITDMEMPFLDGPSLTRALRRMNPHVHVIGSSGITNKARLAEATTSGMNTFLSKPYTLDTLLKTIHEVLHQK